MQDKKKWTPVCSPDCRGWHISGDDFAVEVCDECERFESDFEAFYFAATDDYIHLRKALEDIKGVGVLEDKVKEAFTSETGCEDFAVGYTGEIDAGQGFLILPLEGHMPLATAAMDEDGEVVFQILRRRNADGDFLKEWAHIEAENADK